MDEVVVKIQSHSKLLFSQLQVAKLLKKVLSCAQVVGDVMVPQHQRLFVVTTQDLLVSVMVPTGLEL